MDEVRLANDVVVATFPSTTIRIDETILVQIRSEAIDAIIQCYHQVMGGGGGGSRSLSSSLMDLPVAIGVGAPAVKNSSPISSMTMTSCSINTADCVTHATAISATATATPSNTKNSIASASPSTFPASHGSHWVWENQVDTLRVAGGNSKAGWIFHSW
jgi:hypothetical protein